MHAVIADLCVCVSFLCVRLQQKKRRIRCASLPISVVAALNELPGRLLAARRDISYVGRCTSACRGVLPTDHYRKTTADRYYCSMTDCRRCPCLDHSCDFRLDEPVMRFTQRHGDTATGWNGNIDGATVWPDRCKGNEDAEQNTLLETTPRRTTACFVTE